MKIYCSIDIIVSGMHMQQVKYLSPCVCWKKKKHFSVLFICDINLMVIMCLNISFTRTIYNNTVLFMYYFIKPNSVVSIRNFEG